MKKEKPARIDTVFVECDCAGEIPVVDMKSRMARRKDFGLHRVEVVYGESGRVIAVHCDCDGEDPDAVKTVESTFVDGKTCMRLARAIRRVIPMRAASRYKFNKEDPDAALIDMFPGMEEHFSWMDRRPSKWKNGERQKHAPAYRKIERVFSEASGIPDDEVSFYRFKHGVCQLRVGVQNVAEYISGGRWARVNTDVGEVLEDSIAGCPVCDERGISRRGMKRHCRGKKHKKNTDAAVMRGLMAVSQLMLRGRRNDDE